MSTTSDQTDSAPPAAGAAATEAEAAAADTAAASSSAAAESTAAPSADGGAGGASSSASGTDGEGDPEAARAAALALKDEGNKLYADGDYEGAAAKYGEGLKLLKAATGSGDTVLYCNRAAAFIALKRYVPACRDAMLGAEEDPTNWKAFYRQGLALMAMTPKRFRTEQAIKAFEHCLEMESLPESSKGRVKAELKKARARSAQQEAETPMPEACSVQ